MPLDHSVKFFLLAVLLGISASVRASDCPQALDYRVRPLAQAQTVHLCELMRDKVVLVVNTASKCGNTPQYEGLERLYERYRDRGLVVAGFPSNDFAGQEPGSENQIQTFCRLTYGVKFPMFEKTRVKGASADPFYQHLARITGEKPRWNFHKYLLDRDGRVVASFPSQMDPEDQQLVRMIEELL